MIANTTKSDSKVYQSLSHKILDNLETDSFELGSTSFSFFDWDSILLIALSAMAVLLFLLVIQLHLRVKALTSIVFLLQRVTPGHAQTIPPVILDYFQGRTTSVAPTPFAVFIPQLSAYVTLSEIVTAVIFVVFFIFVAYRSHKSRHPTHSFKVLLEIGNQDQNVLVKILELLHNHTFYEFRAANFFKTLSVSGLFRPTLYFVWNDLEVVHQTTNMSYRLDVRHSIDIYQAWKIRQILAHPYYVLMWAKPQMSDFRL